MTLHRSFVLREAQHVAALTVFLRSNWQAFADDGKPLQVEVSPFKAKRNTEQNKRYWATLREIAEQAWIRGRRYSDEVWHEEMKRRFIGMDELPNGDSCGLSSTTLSVHEFADYVTQVEQYAVSQLGVIFHA